MITESDVYQEHPGTTFAWALFASLLFNIFAWVVALWLTNLHLVVPQPTMQEREYSVTSSSMTISKRVVPRPRARAAAPMPAQKQTQMQSQQVAFSPLRPMRREGETQSTLRQRAPAQPQIQTQFAQPAHAPLSIATIDPRPPSTFHESFTINLPGSKPDELSGLLTPLRSWADGNLHCYYLHYVAQWSGGASEEGNIPWPACYAPAHDPFPTERRTHIPAPPPDYRLPSDATIGPWLRGLYEAWLHG